MNSNFFLIVSRLKIVIFIWQSNQNLCSVEAAGGEASKGRQLALSASERAAARDSLLLAGCPLVGCWLGGLPTPLDWERPWQVGRPTPSTAQPSLQSLPPAFSHIYSRVYCSLILVQHLNVRCAQEWPKTCALGCLGGQVFASLAVLLARRPLARCCWRSRARPDRAKKV